MARRTKEDAERTRLQLLDTALALFSKKGLANVTLAQVASAAGVTRGAIYWHFKDKEEMINALWDQAFQPMTEQVERVLEDDDGQPMQALEDMCGGILHEMVTNERLLQITRLCQQAVYDEKMQDTWRAQCIKDQESLQLLIAKAREKDELRDDLSDEIIGMMVMSFISGVIERWIAIPELTDIETYGQTMLSVFFESLSKKG